MERISNFVATIPGIVAIPLIIAVATGAHFLSVYAESCLKIVEQALRSSL